MLQEFDNAAYLTRLGIDVAVPDAAGLARLQEAQIKAFPFENFDPLLGRTPVLGLAEVSGKVLPGGRGGYCFELNTLFEAGLRAAGYAPRRLLARVRMGAPSGGPRAHLALRVEVDGKPFLADAGFGGPGPLVPLDLDCREEQAAPNGIFRLSDDAVTGEIVVERLNEDGWFPLFGFDEAYVLDADIAGANHLCATWDQFPFVAHAMFSGWKGDVRTSLLDRAVTVEGPEGVERRELSGFADFEQVVRHRIGVDLPGDALTIAWQRICAAPAMPR